MEGRFAAANGMLIRATRYIGRPPIGEATPERAPPPFISEAFPYLGDIPGGPGSGPGVAGGGVRRGASSRRRRHLTRGRELQRTALVAWQSVPTCAESAAVHYPTRRRLRVRGG